MVGIIMGSRSDWETMRAGARDARRARRFRARCASSRRTGCPTRCSSTPRRRASRGIAAIIAGAGGAAHLPGMTAAKTLVPVIGVPVQFDRAARPRFAALDRADAARRSGRNDGDRRRRQRRAVRGAHRRAARSGASRERLAALRREDARRRGLQHARSERHVVKTIGVIGGGQLGRMFALDAKRMGYDVDHARSAGALAARASRRRADRRRVRRHGGDRGTGPAQRRGHVRVRERRDRVGRALEAARASRLPVERRAARHAGSILRKALRARVRHSDGGSSRRSRRVADLADAARHGRLPGGAQDRARRIRRQGPVARRVARPSAKRRLRPARARR